jgi:multisubunit Na+/H+ antiporter MnhE subunit
MIGFVLRAAGLVAIYLLVLTSIAPGDVLVGAILAVLIVWASHPRGDGPTLGWRRWTVALLGTLASTGREMVVGTVRTVRFALGSTATGGFVTIPRDDRSRREVALWGVLTGEAPDEYPVDVVGDRLIVHLLDARDPAAVRQRHTRTRDRWHRHVVD